MNEDPSMRAVLDDMARRLADEGKLVEAGWIAFRLSCIPMTASDVQLREMRIAFMSGAHHLFFAIIQAIEEGDEPTDSDLERMDKVAAELKAFLDGELKPRSAATFVRKT